MWDILKLSLLQLTGYLFKQFDSLYFIILIARVIMPGNYKVAEIPVLIDKFYCK